MSVTKNSKSAPSENGELAPQQPNSTTYHPAPSMLWLVVPLMLLMLYGYLSR